VEGVVCPGIAFATLTGNGRDLIKKFRADTAAAVDKFFAKVGGEKKAH
jgi:hypothetical protein